MDGDEQDDDDLGLFTPEHGGWEVPPEVRQELVECLDSADPEVRREAIEMLAHALDDDLASRALQIANHDPDDELRAAAASVLAPALAAAMTAAEDDGAAPSPLSPAAFQTVRQGLRHLYYDSAAPKEVRRRALEAAVQAPEAWHEGAVRAAAASPDPEWRASAVFCMVRLPGFEAELLEALRDQQPLVRLEASRAVGDAQLIGAVPRLLALARAADEEAIVRMAAMESLGLLGAREAAAPLRELAEAADPELAFAARAALARLTGWGRQPQEEGEDLL